MPSDSAPAPVVNTQRIQGAVPEQSANIQGTFECVQEMVPNNQSIQKLACNSPEISEPEEEISDAEEIEDNSKLHGIKFDSCVQPDDLSLEANKSVSIAPGEGKRPMNILSDENFEELSFPTLFPTGQFGRIHKRPVPLSAKKYFQHHENKSV